jgi:hypothetical protein
MGNIKSSGILLLHTEVMSPCCTTMGIYDNGKTMKKVKHYIVFHTRYKKMAYKENAEELYRFTVYENGIQGRR